MAVKAKEIADQLNWDKISKKHSIAIQRYHENKRVVSREELILLWGLKSGDASNKTIQRYIKKGMPKCDELSSRYFQVFYLDDVAQWRTENIDKVQSARSKSKEQEENADTDDTDEDEDNYIKSDMERKLKADADKAVEDAIIARLKREKEEGSLISSEELDIAQAELATVYQTFYMNDKKLLPVQLHGKNKDEMRVFLDTHYSKRMEDLSILINKEFPDCDKSIYEIMMVALDNIKQDISPSEIVKKLGVS